MTSFQTSLSNLHTNYIDSIVLHSPLRSLKGTLEVWSVFESLKEQGKVRFLGISNCYDLGFFKALYEEAKIKPTFLQNRFYAQTGYDHQLRQFCREKQVHYQSFWTLTANPHIIESAELTELAKKYSTGPAQVFYKSLIDEGIVPLIGTTSKQHMEEDLAMLKVQLSAEDRSTVWGKIKQ